MLMKAKKPQQKKQTKKTQQRITKQIPEVPVLCVQRVVAFFELVFETVTKDLQSVTLLSIKGNKRNSKQRPTATVCAAIDWLLCTKRNSPRQMAGPRPQRPPGNATP